MISIGYWGLVSKVRIAAEPHNSAPEWHAFDFEAAAAITPAAIGKDAANVVRQAVARTMLSKQYFFYDTAPKGISHEPARQEYPHLV
jgi:hypothetical protein